jgi:hypothetical protein
MVVWTAYGTYATLLIVEKHFHWQRAGLLHKLNGFSGLSDLLLESAKLRKFQKRSRCGAVVVDLERHRPIALLKQRSVAVVAAWLRQHPTIEIVARDRSEEFAAAIREALPLAVQVADRFHLIGNMVEHLDRFVTRQWKETYRAIIPPASMAQGEAQASYHSVAAGRSVPHVT